MRVFLVNPNHLSFGIGVITPRWLYVIAAATPRSFGDPVVIDESLEQIDASQIQAGDVVGIGIHSGNALRGYEVGRMARERGAYVIFGGIQSSLYPEEAHELGGAHATVKGDGDVVWSKVLADCSNGGPQRFYDGGHLEGDQFVPARWDLMPRDAYMWASVQTVRGCPKHCSFCSVWRTDGQRPRQRTSDMVIREVVELRRMGFCFIALADDNFYPVTLEDLKLAESNNDNKRLEELRTMREERFELMARLAEMPKGMVFFTQITMEVAEDPEFLDAMRKAQIKGALVGVESVTEEGLKAVFKDFQLFRRKSGAPPSYFSETRGARPGFVHLRAVHGPAGYLRCDRRAGGRSGGDGGAVCADDPVPRDGGLPALGKEDGKRSHPDCRFSSDPLLAHSPGTSTEDVHAPSDHVRPGNPPAHAEGVGYFLIVCPRFGGGPAA